MTGIEASYHRMESTDDEEGSSPGDHETLVHTAEGSKTRWHHIEDLDAFFTRVYLYHQKGGFQCMILDQVLDLCKFVFVVVLGSMVWKCVDYGLLFENRGLNITDKVTLPEVLYHGHQCSSRIGESAALVSLLIIAAIFWAFQLLKLLRNMFLLHEMKAFFKTALHIDTNDIGNITWHEVQQRLMRVQHEQQMCIHKQDLTELDIYNRILRFENYMVAMVNKDVLPMRHDLPFVGEVVFFSQPLKYALEMILFYGPWSLFANNYNLKEEYKRRSNREQLVRRLQKLFVMAAVVTFILGIPFLVWQIFFTFFNYAEMAKREPGRFGARRWSMYSRLYLRHFNELDHEFQARLNRGYRPSTKYLNCFHSPILAIFADFIVFVASAILAVVLALALWDEDVLRVEHILLMIAGLTAAVAIFRAFVPDENAVSCPEQFMKKVLSQIHYVPPSWHGRAQTDSVRKEFSQLFQYKAVYIIESLLSPILTPVILLFSMPSCSGRIIDFFRNFTIEIAGVGDVCSFAQMDVRKHGDPRWQVTEEKRPPPQPFSKTEGGKTELSLIHFAITNPTWKPPQSEDKFLNTLKNRAHQDALMLSRNDAVENPLLTSLQSLESIELPQASILQQPMPSIMMSTMAASNVPMMSQQQQQRSLMRESVPPASLTYEESMMTSTLPQQQLQAMEASKLRKRVKIKGGARHEGSMEESGLGLVASVIEGQQGLPMGSMHRSSYGNTMAASMLRGNAFGQGKSNLTEQSMVELAPVEMGISALYMHELYHNRLIHDDRTARWESVADGANSSGGSFHGNDSSQTGDLYRSSEREMYQFSSNAKQPLLKPSNSGSLPQNNGQSYHSFHQQTMSDEPRPLSRQQPFITMGFDRTPRTYSSLNTTPQGQRSDEEAVQDINLGSDSDDEDPEIQAPEIREDPEAHPHLPTLGFTPTYREHQMGSDQYRPPQL